MSCPSQQTCPNQKVCPNDDPGFSKLLNLNSPEKRSNLFIVCVITRTLLYSGVYVYRDKPWMPYIVGVLALASIFQLTRPTQNTMVVKEISAHQIGRAHV